MAEVVNSLFGITPESLMAERENALQAQAMQYAKMDPFQRATAAIYSGANRLGGAVGGLLGAQDPEMMRIEQRQQLLQGADISDPKVLRERAAAAMQQNDYAAAQQLATRAMDIEAKQASTAKDLAAANREKQASIPSKIAESDAIASYKQVIRTLEAGAQTPEVVASIQVYKDKLAALEVPKERKTQVVGVAKGTDFPVYEDDTGQFTYVKGPDGKQIRQPYYGGVDRTTAKVSATATTQGEGEYAKGFGKGLSEQDLGLKVAAENAPSALEGLASTRKLLSSGKVFTGAGADVKLNLLALGQSLGATGKNDDEVIANTQQLQQQRSKAVLNQIKTSGLGTGQGFTDKDLVFLENTAAGRITLSAETIRRQLDVEEAVNKALIKKWNTRVEQLPKDFTKSMGLSTVSPPTSRPYSDLSDAELEARIKALTPNRTR